MSAAQAYIWRCWCGRMTLVLPFAPLLRAPCCLEPYVCVGAAGDLE